MFPQFVREDLRAAFPIMVLATIDAEGAKRRSCPCGTTMSNERLRLFEGLVMCRQPLLRWPQLLVFR